uniref:ATP synthase complex subunit 8 n=1 Tax=Pelopidas mathias TaxID=218750 RepID=A0A7U1AU03_PELMT|nr:ATP synthase F0 subunit 8 [Pelopidas mathias]QQY86881.1 ATP synthase F0 subunit 8 [Pelopidas mathias]
MPQMMPINWIFSLFMFIMIFIMFNMLNYYISIIKMNNKMNNNNFLLKKNNWKW